MVRVEVVGDFPVGRVGNRPFSFPRSSSPVLRSAMDFFNKVADIAEEDGHHPDLHLEQYRKASIELWTHAIGGLSENDFILAAKIDQVPVELKK